ncbi:hypothetical protein RND81_03G178900 [Saponaria officinalis]
MYKPKLMACDFHFNLALLIIESDTPLSPVTLKGIDDTLSIDPTQHQGKKTSRLRPHSDLFNIVPGTQIVSVARVFIEPDDLDYGFATFSSRSPSGLSCNELYELKHGSLEARDGAPALNSLGETIGIIFSATCFLPSDTILRWWNHYKISGEFCRPFVGMEVANLHDAELNFLEQFITIFPGVSSSVIVTKVNHDSPAGRSGIRSNDVIVKIDGKLVQSKVKFYEHIWRKVGKSVELKVVRVTNGEEVSLRLLIEEATPNEFNRWQLPSWRYVYV